ncbi:MAG: IMP dehydrogenase [Candidatus Kerfeldbacteria bacterium]|nr:IMP dehydrogenase [Candidatus Kerfeldbacteria bacterium]
MIQRSIPLGLTYDDVLLVPKKTPVASRQDVSVVTSLSRHLRLNIPIVSANQDTVTESMMAIAMAREGGFGIIHRFMSIEQQVAEVTKVKRWSHVVVGDPYTLTTASTLRDFHRRREHYGITSFLVVDRAERLVGIVTARDVLFEDDLDTPVEKVMTPKSRIVTAAPTISLPEAKQLLHQRRIEKLPLVDRDGKPVGLITMQDILKREQYPNAVHDKNGRLLVGAAIGVKDDYVERAKALLAAGTDALVLDIAHGHSDSALRAIREIREKFGDVELIAGNVATAAGAADLIKAGVDAVKVGVGPGAACTTRVVTGAGVPQLTAIMDCASVATKHRVPLIADGGIQSSGDVTKALAAGASTVMCGNLFAGTDESPGSLVTRAGRKVKVFRGMASRGAAEQRVRREHRQLDDTTFNEMVPEGVEAVVPYRGSARDIIHQLVGGLRSGMSYCGSRTIDELHEQAEFIQITEAGWKESLPHDAEVTS